MRRTFILTASIGLTLVAGLDAQMVGPIELSTVYALAESADARHEIAGIERESSTLRSDNLRTARLPALSLRADASYQSEVITFTSDNPGFSPPSPANDGYAVTLDVDWRIWDGGETSAREQLENARLAGTVAGLDAELYVTRSRATDAFFGVLALQQQAVEIGALADDLATRLNEVRVLVDAGVALPGASATLGAELLELRQRQDAITNERSVALATLSRLIGRQLELDAELLLPDLSDEVASLSRSIAGSPTVRPEGAAHPQFAVFEAQRAQADRQADLIQRGQQPSVSFFGQLGYGRPGFDQFNNSLHDYWRAGLRVSWTPWRWGRDNRQLRETRLAIRAIEAREKHFTDELLRALERPLRTIEYMRTALSTDDDIINLREEAANHARAQFGEGAISAASYSTAFTALEDARIARLRHRVELARAEAHVLLTLGLDLP